jgi:glutamyl-tRNA reductase
MASFGKQLSQEEQEAANQYAEHLTDKYARQLIKNLRKVTNNGRRTELTDLLGDIFRV